MVSLKLYDNGDPPEGGNGGTGSEDGGDDACCGNGLEKVYNTTAVRYGYMKHVGEFTRPDGMVFTCGAKVVIQTNRGIEIGDQVSVSCAGCDKHVSRDDLKTYIKNSGADSYRFESGRILREATPDDLGEDMRLRERTRRMTRAAQDHAIRQFGRDRMKIVECEYLLGGERAIFYFMADGRIDFRGLVKELSQEFQTRIQMHQVGARDEARLLADFETCGREVCCKSFLKTLKPISMRMAKLQRATLDPSKVSGRCGRLKCCLRYEHESYESLDASLPKKGEKVLTSHGHGTVIDRQILTQLVQVDLVAGEGTVAVVVEDVLERRLTAFPPTPPPVRPEPVRPAKPRPARSRPPQGAPAQVAPNATAQDSGRSRPKPEAGGRRRPPQDRPAGDRPASQPGAPTDDPQRTKKRRRRRRKRPPRGAAEGGAGDKPAGNG